MGQHRERGRKADAPRKQARVSQVLGGEAPSNESYSSRGGDMTSQVRRGSCLTTSRERRWPSTAFASRQWTRLGSVALARLPILSSATSELTPVAKDRPRTRPLLREPDSHAVSEQAWVLAVDLKESKGSKPASVSLATHDGR